MPQNRIIGRVLSVDNFRVFIKIEEDLKGTYKSGISGIYEVARINSYLIIPVGSDRIVALITRVTMKDEAELDKQTATITLPNSARYVSATMLGTITIKDNTECFIQGVYSFPALDNPVWYVTEKDLDQIFDNKKSFDKIDYSKDFYLPIGTSPAFANYQVKMCPDQFFVKHAAILGNTGSGKSCTLTSILRNLFKYDYNGQKLQNAHFVIFDTNGEYKAAFLPDIDITDKNKEELTNINAYYYGGENEIKVPYWLMDWNDFRALLKPSDGTQAPILNRAIGLAKNEVESIEHKIIPLSLRTEIETLIDISFEDLKKRTGYSDFGNWKYKLDNEIKKIGEALTEYDEELSNSIIQIAAQENFNNALIQQPLKNLISDRYKKLCENYLNEQITSEQNIDLPIWFDYQKLCSTFIDSAISQENSSNAKLNEFISTLRLRMNSFLNDKRIAIPLMLKDNNQFNKYILPQFLSLILGDYNRYFKDEDSDNFINSYNNNFRLEKKTNQINIIDVSQLPYEVLETVTGILGRIILEFLSNFMHENRGKYPVVIVLEEAQNYISEEKDSVAKIVFERIAREGRKFGLSLIVSSQRPSELSKTVLSQCNSFIIHRIQNPDDQKYIRGLISSANADLLDQLPVIPQQHAIITGDCVRTPIQVRIDDVNPTPNSHNPEFISNWLKIQNIPYEEICNKWLGKTKTADKEQTESDMNDSD